jgi:hypothetical protein
MCRLPYHCFYLWILQEEGERECVSYNVSLPSAYISFKETVSRDFRPPFFCHKSIAPRALINTLKCLLILFRFRAEISEFILTCIVRSRDSALCKRGVFRILYQVKLAPSDGFAVVNIALSHDSTLCNITLSHDSALCNIAPKIMTPHYAT